MATPAPPRDALPLRQRQRLIDASITALHLYGPTGTTVARVVAIAEMSPGIVRFYFRSKGAMLVESLQFLATEFEERVMAPVAALRDQPALALRRLVELYLDPEIASPRKISVWYAFWGEATARQEYLALCGQKDASFAALVQDLVDRMIAASGRRHLDGEAVALGLIGVLELMWQNFAFVEEADIDRPLARKRCMAYLSSVFPREFAAFDGAAGTTGLAAARSPQAHADDERDRVFRGAWQFAGHEHDIPATGDVAALDLVALRVLIVRDARGMIRAFRNACRGAPHALVTKRRDRCTDGRIACDVHGLAYGLDGRGLPPRDGAGLLELDVHRAHGLVFVRSPVTAAARRWPEPELGGLDDLSSWLPGEEFTASVAADWKTVVRTLLASAQRQFVAPNLLVEKSPDALAIVQVLPAAAGGSTVRRFGYARTSQGRKRGTERGSGLERELALAESTQLGEADPDYRPDAGLRPSPAVAAFEHLLLDAE